VRWFLGKSKIYHEPPDWAIITDIALAFHVAPWDVEENITPEWLARWDTWKAESKKK